MLRQLWHAIKSGLSFRHKLLALVIVPLLLLTFTVIYFIASWSIRYTQQHLFSQVNVDIHIASSEFRRIQADKQSSLSSLSQGHQFLTAFTRDDTNALIKQLDQVRKSGEFDFVNLLKPAGTQKLNRGGWAPWQMPQSELTRQLFGESQAELAINTVSGIEIYPPAVWAEQANSLGQNIVIPITDTPRSSPTTRVLEDQAMVIRVIQRVVDSNGRVIALLEGGTLLNRNFKVVDGIRDLVYVDGGLIEGSLGTVTVFLGDVRISTNVLSEDNSRALGTRVSAEVRQRVLEQGQTWIDRAFVVNDWYISAYEPILDVSGNEVGMLYTGFLEEPYRWKLMQGIALISLLLLGGSLLAIATAVHGARSIFKPVETIARVIRATALGERRRIGKIDSGDEIGELALQFDYMLDTLEQNQSRIENDAMQLEEKVQMRTVELEQQNLRLQESIMLVHETRQRLAMAEKLAAVGQLTAGVAHEINNPTAVILGNMDILIDEMGDTRSDVQTEIDLIISQVYRIRSITDQLLQYSRPGPESIQAQNDKALIREGMRADESSMEMSPVDTNPAIDMNDAIVESIYLVQHELVDKSVRLDVHYGDSGLIKVELQELQQVLVNLISNAVEAVSQEGGHIQLSTGAGDGLVWFVVQDNGTGIAADDMGRLFDPFFTRGKEQGTGLGLSVSYGIVRRYEGQIEVESEPSKGARFTVVFPAFVDSRRHDETPPSLLAPA